VVAEQGLNNLIVKIGGVNEVVHKEEVFVVRDTSKIKEIERAQEGVKYVAIDPDPTMTAKELVGKRVRMWWPRYKRWYDSTVLRRVNKMHEVAYDDGEDEIYNKRMIGYKRGTKWKLLVPATSL